MTKVLFILLALMFIGVFLVDSSIIFNYLFCAISLNSTFFHRLQVKIITIIMITIVWATETTLDTEADVYINRINITGTAMAHIRVRTENTRTDETRNHDRTDNV